MGWSPIRFLTFCKVLTGRQPFRDMKPPGVPYHVSSGFRPEKPADAEAIGISDSLWKLIQKCWQGERARRPQVQEVVVGVGDAAASWSTEMPPSVMEYREESVEQDSDELEHGAFYCSPLRNSPIDPSCSWDIRTLWGYLLQRRLRSSWKKRFQSVSRASCSLVHSRF